MTGQSPSSFGDALRQARIAAGMTQEALAIRSGLGVRSIQGLEQGESQPRRETLRRLGTALQLPIDQAAEWERCTQPAPRQRRQAAPGPETTLGDWGARLAARHNFPTPLNRFIGRERESIEVKRLLRANRLLTLTGPGGCGKSRLALHVAAEMREDFAYGIWLVELAAVSNPALVPRVVARATGLQEHAGEDPARTLAEAFSLGPRLLVLDNCEHLVNACAELADLLLGACPQLRILATTRESLGINGEAIWHVPCLSLPDPYQSLSLEIVRRSEAVSLFVERAVASCPEFVLTEETARRSRRSAID